MHTTTRSDEAQNELGQVRRGISGPYNPRTPAPPPVPAMQAEADARPEPPDPLRTLLHAVSTCWYLWGGKP
jgi:hypothetical protein